MVDWARAREGRREGRGSWVGSRDRRRGQQAGGPGRAGPWERASVWGPVCGGTGVTGRCPLASGFCSAPWRAPGSGLSRLWVRPGRGLGRAAAPSAPSQTCGTAGQLRLGLMLPSAEWGPSRAFRGLIPDRQPRFPPRGFWGAGRGPCRKQNLRPNPDPKRNSHHHLISFSRPAFFQQIFVGLCCGPAQLGAGHAVAAEQTWPGHGAATWGRASQRQRRDVGRGGGHVTWARPGPRWGGPSVGWLCAPLWSPESVICPSARGP